MLPQHALILLLDLGALHLLPQKFHEVALAAVALLERGEVGDLLGLVPQLGHSCDQFDRFSISSAPRETFDVRLIDFDSFSRMRLFRGLCKLAPQTDRAAEFAQAGPSP